MNNVITDIFRLDELGFSHHHIARMLHTNKDRLRRWRNSSSVPNSNSHYLATLITLCDYIEEKQPTWDIADWFETPLLTNVPITPIDIFTSENVEILMNLIDEKISPEEALTQHTAKWPKLYRSYYEVFTASDGDLSIRHK